MSVHLWGRWSLGLLTAALCAAPAVAQNVSIVSTFSGQGVSFGGLEFPAGLDGRVVLECTVGKDDAPRACRVVAQDPKGAGYGELALQYVRQGKVPIPGDHPPPGQKMRLPVGLQFGS